MADASTRWRHLLDEDGRTFAAEAGIRLADKPQPLFQLLVLSSLLSANISHELGLRAAKTLFTDGFRTAKKMAEATDHDRWDALAEARTLRKEQTARQLGKLAGECLDSYGGDLRRLLADARSAAGEKGDLRRELADRLRAFTGIGPVGVDIFCREVQAVWPELRPWADARVADAAKALKLPGSAAGLAKLVGSDDLSVAGAVLIRHQLDA